VFEQPYVFLSYTRHDQVFVDKLVADLQQAGVRVWLDTEQIQPGQQWPRAIADALKNAVVLLYVSSRQSRGSIWMEKEFLAFFRTGRLVIPVIVDDAGEQALPSELQQFQWVDFRQSYDVALNKLLSVFPPSVKSDSAITTAKEQLKGYVFISYAEEDADFVEQLRGFLSKRKYGYWDYAESDRNYHTQFVRELEGVIADAAATLSVLSEAWKDSKWTMREYFFSEEVGTPVFLLRAKDMGPSLAIAGTPYIDFVSNVDAGFQKLDRELKRKGL
jgi:hypothetical protein